MATKKPKIKLPEGFADEGEFLAHMRKQWADDVEFDKENRDAALDDLKFYVGLQWAEEVRQRREAAFKPVLTFNRLVAYVAQVLGNRRLNETTVKVVPDNGGQKDAAEVREGLIRSIQKISKAESVYDRAMEPQVICGIGNFQVHLEYTDDDVFEQELKIAAIPDPHAVIWDRMLSEPTGADAEHVFVQDSLPEKEFFRRWPWATPTDIMSDFAGDMSAANWYLQNTVRVVSYWRMCDHKRTLALMQDGKTLDITDNQDPQVLAGIDSRPDGSPYIREVRRKYAEMYLCSGLDILEGPYVLPIDRVPVFRVPAWEINIGEKKHRWGLVRFLKDPQRLHNFWRSTVAEKLMMAPRAKFIAADTAIEGHEKEWRTANISDDPVLTYNGGAGQPPIIVPPVQIEQALIAEAQMSVQDMRDISNLHEANLGMPSNEVSGKAILARQRIGDLGTVIYHDNLNAAIEECGRVLNALLPVVYDTPRVVRIIGPEGKENLQAINDISNGGVDITAGKYAVSLVTGPSYTTKRIEAAETLMSLVNAVPQVGQFAMDIIFKAMDLPGAGELERRFRKLLPPGMVDPSDMTPEEQQAAQGQAQQAQQALQIQMQAASLKAQNLMADTAQKAARAQRETALAQQVAPNTQIAAAKAQADIQAKAHKAAMDTIDAAEGHANG